MLSSGNIFRQTLLPLCLCMLRLKAKEDKKIFKEKNANTGNDICSSYSDVPYYYKF